MTSKERAYLRGLAMKLDPVIQIGKASVTPELTRAVDEALEARELIKLHILKNCFDDPREIADVIAERTHSEVVQVIGKKIILYRKGDDSRHSGQPSSHSDRQKKRKVRSGQSASRSNHRKRGTADQQKKRREGVSRGSNRNHGRNI